MRHTMRLLMAALVTMAAILVGGGTAHAENCPIMLTFDDGPSQYTDGILNALTAHGAQATFFEVGNMVNTYPDQARHVVGSGMRVGSHSMWHRDLRTYYRNPADAAADVQQAADIIGNVTGVRPNIWRPPYGDTNGAINDAVGMPAIFWTIDSLDWKTHNADSTYRNVTQNVQCGSTILMHDIQPATANSINAILDNLVSRGFQMVPIG